jgi:hypothetical protein
MSFCLQQWLLLSTVRIPSRSSVPCRVTGLPTLPTSPAGRVLKAISASLHYTLLGWTIADTVWATIPHSCTPSVLLCCHSNCPLNTADINYFKQSVFVGIILYFPTRSDDDHNNYHHHTDYAIAPKNFAISCTLVRNYLMQKKHWKFSASNKLIHKYITWLNYAKLPTG